MIPKKIVAGCVVAVFMFQYDVAHAYQWGELQLDPWASVKEEYNSNITYAHRNPLADFITAPRLGLDGTYTGKNESAELMTWVEEDIYSKYSSFDNLSEYLTAAYTKDFSYFDHFTFNDSFMHAETPSSFSQEFGRVSGFYQYYQDDLSSQWAHEFNSRLTMRYKLNGEYYDPRFAGLQSSYEVRPGIETEYQVCSWLNVLQYDEFTYRDYTAFGNITKETVGGGLRHYWTPQLYLEGRAGEDFIQPIVGSDVAHPQFIVSLNDQRDQRTLYTLSYSKQYQDTPYSQFLFNSWQASLEVKKDLTQRTSLYASVFTGGGVYVGENLKERLNGAGIGFVIHVLRNADLKLEYRYSDNTSNSTTNSYKQHTGFLELSIKF